MSTTAALAGRRIDASTSSVSRFPLQHVEVVSERLTQLFLREDVQALYCSAACGADLIALGVANRLQIRCTIVIPFDAVKFRETSVEDRPGNWGGLFDRIFADVLERGNIVQLGYDTTDEAAYAATTRRIISEAAAEHGRHLAIAVWDGNSWGPEDATADFIKVAVERGLEVIQVPT